MSETTDEKLARTKLNDEAELKDDIARKYLQRIYLYACILFPISVVLFAGLYDPMTQLAILINGLVGAFWGASYYIYSIGIYYAFVLYIIMREYARFYDVKKHQTMTIDMVRRFTTRTQVVAANPKLVEYFTGLLLVVVMFIVWGLGAAYAGDAIPKAGEENFFIWVLYNVVNMIIFLGWTLLVFMCYQDDLKNNKLGTT